MSIEKKRVPTGPANYLGIEFEFDFLPHTIKFDALRGELGASLLSEFVEIHREAISFDYGYENHMGYEATMLVEETKFEAPLRAMVAMIEKHGAIVDERCGIHVHIDVRNRDAQRTQLDLQRAEQLFYSFVDPVRLLNKAKTFRSLTWQRKRYQTIELRCLEATFDIEKIVAFVKAAVSVVNNHVAQCSEAA